MPPKPRDEAVTDPRVTKRRVTMRSISLGADGKTYETEAVDYVRPDFLEAYLADAREPGKWQLVMVSDEPDAGPGGYHGTTSVPAHLNRPDAGVVYAADGPDGPDMLLTDPAPWTAPADCPAPDADLPGFLAWHRGAFGDTAMIASGTGLRNTLSDSYKATVLFADLYSTTGATAAGTAITGGTPAYASKGLTWGASTNGVVATGATVFDVPSGATVAGFGGKNTAISAYLDGGALPSQAFASQGTYSLTITYTQT